MQQIVVVLKMSECRSKEQTGRSDCFRLLAKQFQVDRLRRTGWMGLHVD